MALKEGFMFIEKLGILDVILPFIFVFTLIFAVFEKVKVFGNTGRPRTYHAVLSLAMALIFVYSQERVSIMNIILLKFTLLLVASIMVFFLMGIFIEKPAFKNHWWIAAILAIITIIATSTFNWFNLDDVFTLLKYFINPIVIAVLFFALVIWFITKPSKGQSSTSGSTPPKPSGSSSPSSAPPKPSSAPAPPKGAKPIGSYTPKEGGEWNE